MTAYQSDFMRLLQDRGYIHQCSDGPALDADASQGMITAYIGYDCTAPSLHVGNLISIMMLRKLQQSGHKPIVLMGGGTTRIGDPTFRKDSRKLLSDKQIQQNMANIKGVFSKFLTFGEAGNDAIMVNNDTWLKGINYIDFLRDYGRHFSINRMLTFDFVKQRLDREQPLSFLEFNYMILQAYDFLELNRSHKCTLQMGGSDQWGNIINGIELGRRVDSTSLYGLTTALLTTSSGAKMGKTAQGAIWLNEDMLSVYDYWQFWRNTEDNDVGRFLRLFTEIPEDEIVRLESLEGQEMNDAKKILATRATALAHGVDAAETAAQTARETFETGITSKGLPSVDIAADEFANGIGLLQAFVMAGLATSNSEARRHIKGSAAKVNDVVVSDERAVLNTDSLAADGTIKLSVGKKRHVLLRPV